MPRLPDLAGDTNAQLLYLLRLGNEGAFTEIYQRYWDRLFDVSEHILGNPPVSQDLVQEVFIALWRQRSSVQIQYLDSYLYQAIRFQAFKYTRDKMIEKRYLSWAAGAIPNEVRADDPIICKELQQTTNRTLACMPEDQRSIFSMHREEDITYKQIAAYMGVSVKTVEKKISQSLRSLRTKCLEPGLY